MRRSWVLATLLITGCEEMPSSGEVFRPVAETAPAASVAVEPTGPQGGFDFESDGREGDEPSDSDPELEDLYAGLGIEKSDEEEEPAPPKAPEPQPLNLDFPGAVPAQPVQRAWQPGVPISGSWGVRLVSTVTDAQPPRAILGMPDGSEQVVQPGTLLPAVGVVVLAVGRDAVQIAEIVPEGDRARVSSQVLTALYPGGAAQR